MKVPHIEDLSYEELVELNRRVVDRLKLLDQVRTHAKMLEFGLGEQVCFEGSDGQVVHGTLVRHNRKTVTVVTGQGERWNVSPGLLRRPPADTAPSKPGARIIDIEDGKSA